MMRPIPASSIFAGTLLLAVAAGLATSAQNGQPRSNAVPGGPFGLAQLSPASRTCIDCHKKEDPSIYRMWGESRHYSANVGCFECHGSDRNAPGSFLHYDHFISTVVSPRVCARCHDKQVEEFSASLHASAARIAGSVAMLHAEMVEGASVLKTQGTPGGVAPSAITCSKCHGSTVRVLPNGKLDPATWPNSGIGRINPDGSTGACSSCHTPHSFTAAEARLPETCNKCHTGGTGDIYHESRHAVAFHANHGGGSMRTTSPKWILGEDYSAAPTCATCHMSATPSQPSTHNVGLRLSWNNRPEVSVRPEGVEEALGLPVSGSLSRISWQARRDNMRDVCLNCHSRQWVDNFYIQYDGAIEQYHEKFARPGRELYALARPLMKPTIFANKLDFTWYELWAVDGRRTRQAAAMMSPAQGQRSSQALAQRFYTEFVPELERLVETGLQSGEREKVAAAEALRTRLNTVLNSEYHRWYLGRIDPELAARRAREAEQFRARYQGGTQTGSGAGGSGGGSGGGSQNR
jgi:hydroxylamine dehydrogenase